jgi:hypothetical protein
MEPLQSVTLKLKAEKAQKSPENIVEKQKFLPFYLLFGLFHSFVAFIVASFFLFVCHLLVDLLLE